MSAPQHRIERIAEATVQVDPDLFGWRGGRIVLFGEIAGDRWIVVRGWLGHDTLTDVRRWSFQSPRTFGGQVRRLVMEATGDSRNAAAAGVAATDWAASFA